MYDIIIIGSGPAGLTAAIYASRARLKTLVVAGVIWGGQLMTTTEVENFPGFPEGILGPVLMQNMLKQSEKYGAEFLYENATQVIKNENKTFTVKTYDKEYNSKAVILATGALPRKLGIKGEEEFWAKGVSSCATCDGAFFREKIIAVVGGGDSAMEESNFLSRFASKIYLIHRKNEFRASKIMQEKVKSNPKIEIILNTEIKEIFGATKVEGLKLFNIQTNSESELKLEGLFLAIGHIPVTDFVKGQIELDEMGYIKSYEDVKTSIEGIFVAGDVEDHKYRQAITAAGEGCKAALVAEKWLVKQ